MDKQVEKEAYGFFKYSYPDRWASYFYQLREVLSVSPANILEVGVGDGVLRDYIRNNTKIEYTSIDVAEDLNPDALGSVTAMPFADRSFDAVVAYEILEHIPFEELPQALAEIKRVSRKYVVLSLPHFGPPVKFCLKLPFLPEIKLAFKLPYPKKHVFNGQHYWEIGKKGYSPAKIRQTISEHFDILKEFVPWENQYHHFFVLEKKL
jgi:ubiquinone/menaquinone biosynthesis C-methylase UbiE